MWPQKWFYFQKDAIISRSRKLCDFTESINESGFGNSFGNFWFPISIRQGCQPFFVWRPNGKIEKVELVTLHKTYTSWWYMTLQQGYVAQLMQQLFYLLEFLTCVTSFALCDAPIASQFTFAQKVAPWGVL